MRGKMIRRYDDEEEDKGRIDGIYLIVYGNGERLGEVEHFWQAIHYATEDGRESRVYEWIRTNNRLQELFYTKDEFITQTCPNNKIGYYERCLIAGWNANGESPPCPTT